MTIETLFNHAPKIEWKKLKSVKVFITIKVIVIWRQVVFSVSEEDT